VRLDEVEGRDKDADFGVVIIDDMAREADWGEESKDDEL
jgi:hypothetical protein